MIKKKILMAEFHNRLLCKFQLKKKQILIYLVVVWLYILMERNTCVDKLFETCHINHA